jgi:hypothetical protein
VCHIVYLPNSRTFFLTFLFTKKNCQHFSCHIVDQELKNGKFLGWIPAKYLNNAGQGSNVNYPAYSSDKVFKDHEARSYVERYYPNIFNYENQNQNPYQNQYQQRPPQDYYPNYYNQQPPPYAGGQVKKYIFTKYVVLLCIMVFFYTIGSFYPFEI